MDLLPIKKTQTKTLLAVTTCVGLVLGGCSSGEVKPLDPGADPHEIGIHQSALTRKTSGPVNNQVANNLISQANWTGLTLLQSDPNQNLAVSPASLQIAFSMLAEGAQGQTLTDLETMLGLSGTERQETMNALLAQLQIYEGDPAVVKEKELPETPVLHQANNVALNKTSGVSPTYLDTLATYYGAGAEVVDFSSPQGKKVLDEWANIHTGGLIPKSAIVPTADTFLVLQNAVVLAAKWQNPFEVEDTYSEPFYLADNSAVQTDTMHATLFVKYIQVGDWQAIRLPYSAGFYADFILPAKGTSPNSISPEQLAEITDTLGTVQDEAVEITLPKFNIKSKLDLLEHLESLGIDIVADESRADLSGIPQDQEVVLFVDQAAQQAVLQVDEEGTIAAALTEMDIKSSASEGPLDAKKFVVDHPFLMRIGENDTDWTLFLATIADPTTE